MFGLDTNLVDGIDFNKALERTKTDVVSDFILAPHYSAIYEYAAEELIQHTVSLLRNGEYSPQQPIIIDVPKRSGISRPGAILLPIDRLVYQLIADQLQTSIEEQVDRSRVYSYVSLINDPEFKMFRPTSESWQAMENARNSLCQSGEYSYAVKTDVACYFERIYQHNLINLLMGVGGDSRIVTLLEKVLSAFTEKDSHGILQGMFPSDLLGNFYLSSIDNYLEVKEVPSIRYVDDLYIFYHSLIEAQKGLLGLCKILRDEGLNLNESKTDIMEASSLYVEETEIDRLFQQAREEIQNSEVLIEVEGQYGFETIWATGEQAYEGDEIELIAVRALYNSITTNPLESEKIERFCLPYFALAHDNSAIERSLQRLTTCPHSSRIYCNYLKSFACNDSSISSQIEQIVKNGTMAYDWSLIWPIAVLIEANVVDTTTVNESIRIVEDSRRSEVLRAMAVHLVAKHGNAMQRRLIKHRYDQEPSQYVKSAILYSTRYLPTNERNSCLGAWGSHSITNSLITRAVRATVTV